MLDPAKETAREREQKYLVTVSPHLFATQDIRSVMRDVVIALLPACVFAVLFFGLPALWILLTCSAGAVAAEYFCLRLRGRAANLGDLSALVTGILVAMNLPATIPLWMAALGSFIAIVIGKQVYGGLGNNPFNPALVARIVLLVSFPAQMTAHWPVPMLPGEAGWFGALGGVDAVTAATPLTVLKEGGPMAILHQMPDWLAKGLIGFRGGCLGEGAVIALLLGAAYLLYRRVITWHIPVSYIGTVLLLTGAVWLVNPEYTMNPLFHLLYGGLVLGAFYMATDMVTSPITRGGQVLFGMGCGLIVVLIRFFGGYPEGVAFSILLMNSLVPFLDKIHRPVMGEARAARRG